MAAMDDLSVDDVELNNESNAIEEESNINQAAPENLSNVNEEASNTDRAEFENQIVTNEVASENSSISNDISTGRELGLLFLPAELRVMVLRYLLLEHYPLSTYRPNSTVPAILSTCALIRREAFQILYGENFFCTHWMHPRHSILSNRRISDTIQNVHFEGRLNERWPWRSRTNLIQVIREFGSPAILRKTLNVIFHVGFHHNHLLSWFTGCLRRFINFKIIRIEFVARHPVAKLACPVLCDTQEHDLTPGFGPARYFANACGLEFHPQDYLNSLPSKVDVDWMDYLDGIRLTWNQNPTNPDEPEASVQIF